jgi:hypothetical protein
MSKGQSEARAGSPEKSLAKASPAENLAKLKNLRSEVDGEVCAPTCASVRVASCFVGERWSRAPGMVVQNSCACAYASLPSKRCDLAVGIAHELYDVHT